jgi:aminopeptidase N
MTRDHPLGAGLRASTITRCNKGVWLFHMLRFLLFDYENNDESRFFRFMYELSHLCNNTRYTNEDVKNLAEKHYGQPLDWFFHQWLCGFGYPEYDVEYRIEERDDGHYITCDVETKNVPADFHMPVWIRVESEGGQNSFSRVHISGRQDSFELGPFTAKPNEMIFNEFFSVLSKDHVNKK